MTQPRRRRGGSIRDGAGDPVPGSDEDAAGSSAAASGAKGPAPKAAGKRGRGGGSQAAAAELAMVDPYGDATEVVADVPEMSADEVERRIGAGERARRRRVAAVPAQRIRTAPTNRRVVLWRDSATILIFVILALLAARFILPGDSSVATASATPPPTSVVFSAAPTSTGLVFSAAPTLGQVVNPSLDLHPTATPIPVITLPPPTPTPKPSDTPKPSVKPTVKPSSNPTPTPAPAPVASFSCVASAGYVLTCTDKSVNATGWVWHWGDGSTSGLQSPPPHTYSASDPNPIQVTLDVTGPGGTDSQSTFYDLIP